MQLTTKSGEPIEVFTLSSQDLSVRVSNIGARLLSFVCNGTDWLYGPKTPQELLEDTCYCGAICGRVANRIAGGSFVLDGRTYTLAVNNGPNHLHGGIIGFSDRAWTVEEVTESRLVLSLVSPDGEEGYPGTVTVKAVYTLEERTLTLEMTATTDAPTLLNLTNHAYWNLNGTGTMDDHMLQVYASAYTPMVANIPTGVIAPVAGTLYDLTSPACLGERNAPEAIAGQGELVLPIIIEVILHIECDLRFRLQHQPDSKSGDVLHVRRGDADLACLHHPLHLFAIIAGHGDDLLEVMVDGIQLTSTGAECISMEVVLLMP